MSLMMKRMEMKAHCFDRSVLNFDCATFADVKAFKGKGALRQRLRKSAALRVAVHERMRQLVMDTKNIRARQFALEVYTPRADSARRLRWRLVLGKHALWRRDIVPLLAMFPVELQRWYRDLHNEVMLLNVEERCLRHLERALQRLLKPP